MKTQMFNLHRKYARGKYPEKWVELIFTHTEIVLEITENIVGRLQKQGVSINNNLLTQGVYLHDIGVYNCFDEDLNPDRNAPPYIMHGFIGYKIITNEGFSEQIARFANTHTATGLTKEDIERENIPVEMKDYIPITLEEEILCYADKFHTKYPSFPDYENQVESLSRFDPSRKIKMQTFLKKFGFPNIDKVYNKYNHWHQEFNNWYKTINNI